MRPRTRGIRKSYAEPKIGLEDDDEPIVAPDNDEDGDFGEQDAQGQQNQDEDDQDDNDEDDDDDNSEVEADGAGDKDAVVSSTPKRQRNGAGMTQSRKSFHEIPHYPLETRIVTRVYAGPLMRYARYSALRDSMYGPEYQRIKIIWDLEKRWQDFSVLPPAFPPSQRQGVVPSPWVSSTYESDQERRVFQWYDDYQVNSPEIQRTRVILPKHGEQLVSQADGDIVALVGPCHAQKQYRLSPGSAIPISQSGLGADDPEDVENEKSAAAGWILDVGGIPLSLAWAPSTRKDAQVLAIASIPFSDQEPRQHDNKENGEEPPDKSAGSIQFWEFDADSGSHGLAAPSKRLPVHILTRCFDWGRVKRLEWCPVPMDNSELYGLLAILCGDGLARVIDVKRVIDRGAAPKYEWMESPMVTLGLATDYCVKVTCLTWVNVNRIALGHTDGSVTLWSIYPRRLLQRVGVHTTYIIDICSGYPSNPYMIATVPVGGCATVTDLSQPSSEFTYFPVPAISFQPNMLCWSEPMQGFMGLYPSSTPNTTVAFMHHRYFCQARSICTGPNTVTCISSGATHPFLLMGGADGTVFSCNGLQKLFRQKGEPLYKLRVLEHEYRPLDGAAANTGGGRPLRGASRLLQGFLPELNDDPRTEKRKELDRKKKMESKKKKSRKKKKGGEEEEEEDNLAELDDRLAFKVVAHEPLTRITNIAWNPNLLFSCWAAVAMGSGLVRIMDLGVS